jgi:hypothetical protein
MMICGFRSQIWSIHPYLFEWNGGVAHFGTIPYPECPECGNNRATLKGDYICVQCRYPLLKYKKGKFVGWTGPGCLLHRNARNSIPDDIQEQLTELPEESHIRFPKLEPKR